MLCRINIGQKYGGFSYEILKNTSSSRRETDTVPFAYMGLMTLNIVDLDHEKAWL